MRRLSLAFAAILIVASTARAHNLSRTPTAKEKAALQSAIKEKLKDPTSPLFKWPELQLTGGTKSFPQGKGGVYHYCGLVNAKNSYGAYTGYVPYYANFGAMSDNKIYAVIFGIASADPSDNDSISVMMFCHQYGYFN